MSASSYSTALTSSKQQTAVTPYKQISGVRAMTPATESPGNWQHPRIDEITRRQSATVFTSDNVKTTVYNVTALFVVRLAQRINDDFGPSLLRGPEARPVIYWAFIVVYMLPALNILVACLPLIRRKDDLSDIPLTPAQRKLLNLPPSSKPATPDTIYSTPPRYSRTPSIPNSTGKIGGSGNRNNCETALTGTDRYDLDSFGKTSYGSSVGSSSYGGSINSTTASPLLQRGMAYGRQQPNPFKALQSIPTSSLSPATARLLTQSTTSFASSIFNGAPGTPSPAGGKAISVGLNNKWLYERSRKTSNNVWP